MSLPIPCRHCPLRDTGAFTHNSDEEINFIQGIRTRQLKMEAGSGGPACSVFSGFSGGTVNVATYNLEVQEYAVEIHAHAEGDATA